MIVNDPFPHVIDSEEQVSVNCHGSKVRNIFKHLTSLVYLVTLNKDSGCHCCCCCSCKLTGDKPFILGVIFGLFWACSVQTCLISWSTQTPNYCWNSQILLRIHEIEILASYNGLTWFIHSDDISRIFNLFNFVDWNCSHREVQHSMFVQMMWWLGSLAL